MFDEELAHVGTEGSGGAGGGARPIGWREAHRQLQRLVRRRAALDAEEAKLLLIARDAGAHVELGFASFVEYVASVLGCERRTAYDRVRVAEALPELPAIRAALETGAVSYSAVREITRVAEPATEHAWLDAAQAKTIRELEQMVRERAVGDRPDDPGDPDLTPRTLRLELAPEIYGLWLDTRRRLEAERGASLDDSDVMAALCGRMLHEPETPGTTAPRHTIAVTVCERCDRATADGGGQVIDIGPEALALARCDAVHVGRLDDPDARPTIDIPKKIRRHVERRDHHRCTVPGCRASTELELHHIVPRAQGGGHAPDGITSLCTPHHVAHHAGRLRILGRAPDHLRFEHPDGQLYGRTPPPPDPFVDARQALRDLGYSGAEASAAVDRARARVGTDQGLEAVLRTCLRECMPRGPTR